MIKQRNRKIKWGKRNTYIDQILGEQAKRPTPGVGKYNIRKSEKEIEEDIKEIGKKKHRVSEKRTYLNEIEFLGNYIPGPGQYQPTLPRRPLKKNQLNPKDWVKKHKRIASAKPFDFPSAATYQPEPTMYTTFSKQKAQFDKKDRPKSRNFFGTETRFPNPKKTKSKSFMVTPGPDQYDLVAYWKGKQTKKDEKKQNDWKNVSKGIQKNIYYE
eukprot:TRINITY_DN7079_c0_g1_i1.p1 TRINITY_DN7079_c0_g1~~TRINITY_DN7079_c0_g1_i1.p1  ORF type:complete len:213 (+),score=35.94 TRINITY_DN7079_c0_g1_i1:392-1030(+)